MSGEFARRLEDQARQTYRDLESENTFGIKCWYSAATLFDGPATRVFVGRNPAGGVISEGMDPDHRRQVYESPNYNAFLDELWENAPGAGQSHLQLAVQRTFRTMYDDDWKGELRSTPCINVSPFRTAAPRHVWRASLPWFEQVINHLRPRFIICDGSGENHSAWSALDDLYGMERDPEVNLYNNYSIKSGTILTEPLVETRTIALPSLSRVKGEQVFRELARLGPFE